MIIAVIDPNCTIKSHTNFSTSDCDSPWYICCIKTCLAMNSYINHWSDPRGVGSVALCIPVPGRAGGQYRSPVGGTVD